MTNKLEELFDLEAAEEAYSNENKFMGKTADEHVEFILQEATKGREYQLIEPVKDWDGCEKLRVNHRVKYNTEEYQVATVICNEVAAINSKYRLYIFDTRDLKPIKPKPKTINHSSLEGSGIDCIYQYLGQQHPKITPYVDNDFIKSIRMNHWMVWNGKFNTLQEIFNKLEGYEWDWIINPGIVAFKITGIKEGYKLP